MPQRGLRRSSRALGGLFLLGIALFGALLFLLLVPGAVSAQQAEADVFVAQAIIAYEEKRYDNALAALRQALELDPNNVDALYYSGLVRVAQGRIAEAVAPLEKARKLDPKDQATLFQLGVVYFSLGKYDEAQPLLEEVFDANPRLESLGYYVGFMRYRKKDYQGALRAFRAGASTDPNIQQLARFYTGLALGILGLPERAAAEIEEALRLQPASPLTGPAERLRTAVATAREKERRFRAELRVGGFFDDNVSVIPRKNAKDALVQALRSRRHESPGWGSALRLDYAFLRLGPFEATATYAFFNSYNTDLPSFNIINQLGGLVGTYRGTLGAYPYQAALQCTYDYLTLGGREFVQRQTVVPAFTLVEDANNLSAVQLRFQKKEFSQDTDIPREEKRDGVNWMAGLTHLFRFEGDKHLVRLGYQWDFDDTEGPNSRGTNFSYFGGRFLAGAQYTLPWLGIRLKYDFDVHFRNYRHANTLLPTANPGVRERADEEFTHVFGFSLPLPNPLPKTFLEGSSLTLTADYQRTDAKSNLDVFEFRRNVISVFLVWSY